MCREIKLVTRSHESVYSSVSRSLLTPDQIMFFKMFKMNVLQKLLWADAKNNMMVFAFFSIQHIFINLIHFVFVKRLLTWDSILDLTFLVRLGEEVCKKSEFSGNIRSVRSDFFQTYNPLM